MNMKSTSERLEDQRRSPWNIIGLCACWNVVNGRPDGNIAVKWGAPFWAIWLMGRAE